MGNSRSGGRRAKPSLLSFGQQLVHSEPHSSLDKFPLSRENNAPCVYESEKKKGQLAQLVEQLVYTEKVSSSSLLLPITGMMKLVDVLDLGSKF